jgi:hypothetical protein
VQPSKGPTLSRSCITSAALALLLVLGAAAPALARPHGTPTPAATPTPGPEDPAITAIVRHEFVAWQTGSVDKTHYSADAQSTLTDDTIKHMSTALASYGALTSTDWLGGFAVVGGPPGVKGYNYRMNCTNSPVYMQMLIEPSKQIDAINFLKNNPLEPSPSPSPH